MVVTQLVEQLLLTQEVCSLYPVIGKTYTVNCLKRMAYFKKTAMKLILKEKTHQASEVVKEKKHHASEVVKEKTHVAEEKLKVKKGILKEKTHQASDAIKEKSHQATAVLKEKASKAVEEIKIETHQASEHLKGKTHQASEVIRDRSQNARVVIKDKTVQAGHALKDKTVQASHTLKDKTRQTSEMIKDRTGQTLLLHKSKLTRPETLQLTREDQTGQLSDRTVDLDPDLLRVSDPTPAFSAIVSVEKLPEKRFPDAEKVESCFRRRSVSRSRTEKVEKIFQSSAKKFRKRARSAGVDKLG